MFYQFNQVEQQGPPQNELRVDIDMRSKGQSEQPEWLDQPPPKQRSKRKVPLKPDPPIVKPPDPTLDILLAQLQGSKKKLRKGLPQIIKQEVEHLQHKVFASETNVNQQGYLKSIYEHTGQNKYVRNEIYDTLHVAQHEIQMDIKKQGAPALQHRRIPRNKDQLREMEKHDHYEMLRIKEGNIKDKVGSLRHQFDQEYIKSRLKSRVEEMGGGVDPNYYSIEHPRTKEAEYFVKEIQHRRNEQHNHYDQILSARRERQEYQKEKEAEMKEVERMERRTRLKQYYESKLHKRLQEKQHERYKKEEFKEWIKAYQRERPMEAEKEEQYRMKVLIPELQERHKKLMTIKAEHKPIDPEDIAQHELKYLQFKKDDSIRKRASLELAEEEDQMRKDEVDERFYKGKYRLLVLEQMLEEKYPLSAKDLEQSKKERIKAYDSIVRRSLKSHPERAAGQTLEAESMSHQKFVRRVRNNNGSLTISNNGVNLSAPEEGEEDSLPPIESASDKPNRYKSQDIDTYNQGIKNLHYMKNKVRQSLAREEEHKPKIILIEEKEEVIKPKSYLQIQREKRLHKKSNPEAMQKKAKDKQMQSTDVTGNEQIQAIKSNAEYLDEKLKRHQNRLKNIDDDHFEGKAEMQGEYVQAIKRKLQILGQFN